MHYCIQQGAHPNSHLQQFQHCRKWIVITLLLLYWCIKRKHISPKQHPIPQGLLSGTFRGGENSSSIQTGENSWSPSILDPLILLSSETSEIFQHPEKVAESAWYSSHYPLSIIFHSTGKQGNLNSDPGHWWNPLDGQQQETQKLQWSPNDQPHRVNIHWMCKWSACIPILCIVQTPGPLFEAAVASQKGLPAHRTACDHNPGTVWVIRVRVVHSQGFVFSLLFILCAYLPVFFFPNCSRISILVSSYASSAC